MNWCLSVMVSQKSSQGLTAFSARLRTVCREETLNQSLRYFANRLVIFHIRNMILFHICVLRAYCRVWRKRYSCCSDHRWDALDLAGSTHWGRWISYIRSVIPAFESQISFPKEQTWPEKYLSNFLDIPTMLINWSSHF